MHSIPNSSTRARESGRLKEEEKSSRLSETEGERKREEKRRRQTEVENEVEDRDQDVKRISVQSCLGSSLKPYAKAISIEPLLGKCSQTAAAVSNIVSL